MTSRAFADRLPRRWQSAWPFAAVVAIGALLRLIAYFSVRTLYLDEAALALNLRWRSLPALLGSPLDFAQTAPAGFLLQQQLLLRLLGEDELVLRLVPFLAGLVALPLFVLLARRLLSGRAALVAALLFSVSFYLIYYGSDAKPYMVDVLAAIVALLIGLDLIERSPNRGRVLAYAAFGALAVWLSQPAVLVLGGIAAIVLMAAWRQRRRRDLPALFGMSAAWGLSAGASLTLAFRTLSPDHHTYMREFWHGGFMPVPPTTLDDLLWLPFKLVEFGTEPLGSMIPGVVALILVLGIFWLPRLGRDRSLLIAMPLLVTLAASAVGRYPFGGAFGVFGGRVVLFLLPCLLLIVGAGVEYLLRLTRPRVALGITMLLVLGNVLRVMIWFPSERTELRPLLQHVADHRDGYDFIYVSYADRHVYEWYAPRLGLSSAPTVYGVCATNRPEEYIRDLDRIPAGARAWVTLTHVQPHEGELMLEYIRLSGRELQVARAPGAHAVLFQMERNSTPAEIAALVGDYWVPPQFRRVGCRGSHDWPERAGGSAHDRPDDGGAAAQQILERNAE